MSSRSLVSIFIITLVLTSPLSARLGDTERECVMRYGSARRLVPGSRKPDDLIEGAKHTTHHYQGWEIQVALLNGRAAAEQYRKLPASGTSPRISPDELEAILNAERGTGTWSKAVAISSNVGKFVTQFLPVIGESQWQRTDGSRAILRAAGMQLFFVTPEGIQEIRRTLAAKEAAKKQSIPKF